MCTVYDFGLRIKTLRENHNLTQKEIANKLGVTISTVQKYENNTLTPPIEKLEQMALLFNTSLDYLRNLDNRVSFYLDDFTPRQQKIILDFLENIKDQMIKTDD